jgi:hypothetical protein
MDFLIDSQFILMNNCSLIGHIKSPSFVVIVNSPINLPDSLVSLKDHL